MAVLLNGRKVAKKILNQLKKRFKLLPSTKLAVVMVGTNPASESFVKQKQKIAQELSVNFKLIRLNSKISLNSLTKEILKLSQDKTITGIVVQLPLPKHLDEDKIIKLIPVEKDVDALGSDKLVNPPAAAGILQLLNFYKIKPQGKTIAIVGQGKLIGKPLTKLFKTMKNVKLITCDINTKNLKKQTLKADILISATGTPCLIKKDMVKKKTVIIDAGFSMKKGKIIGDVDFEKVKDKVSYITPNPGGVGPITVAMLYSNLAQLKEFQLKIKNNKV